MNKKIIVGILISLICIVLVYLSVKDIKLDDVFIALEKIKVSYVILFLLIITFMQWLRSYRWGVILQPLEKIDQMSLFSVTSVGFLAIAIIPARVGELARPYLIARRSKIKMSSALGTVFIERVLDGFTVLAIAVIVLSFTDLPPVLIQSGIIFFLISLTMFGFILFLILRRDKALKFINVILNHLPGKLAKQIDAVLHHFIDGLQVVMNIKLLLYMFFLSALIWLVDILAIYVLLYAFGFNLPLIASSVVMIILIVGIAIPTAPGFIGNWHLACVLALSLFGLNEAQTFSFAVIYHFLSMMVLLVLGLAFLPFNKFSVSDMTKQMNHDGKS